jgi:hypothetical protein
MSEPTLEWTRLLGSTATDVANGVAIDSNNNVYITGYTGSSLDGETNAGGNDAFLAKYDSAGTKVWTKLLGTSGGDEAYHVAIDSNNNVYITGYVGGSLDGETNAGSNDAFLAKYDSAGTKLWTKVLGTVTTETNSIVERAYGVSIDSNNNVYITGFTQGSLDGQTNAGGNDAFLAKYDSAGTKLWTKVLGTVTTDSNSISEVAYSVAIDSNNNVYITGSTTGNLDGETHAGSYDAFLAKYDSAGTKVWTKLLGTSANEFSHVVAIDSNNNVYITGSTSGNLDGQTNAGGNDAFLAKYDSAGTKVWTKLLGTSATEYSNGVAIDSNNNVYITGDTYGSLDGETSAGLRDAFLAKYDSAGTKVWTKLLGTSAIEFSNGVAIYSNNNVYITGHTSGNLDGETNAGGASSAFLSKYNIPTPPLSTETEIAIEAVIPTVDITQSVIVVDVVDTLLTTGNETEKSQKRTFFLTKLFNKNAGLDSASGKITMTRDKLLGASSVITKSTMVIKKALPTETITDTSQLASDEAIYVCMNIGDMIVFNTSGGNLKITKTSETQYDIYENYVDNTSIRTKIMSVGATSSFGTFTYVVGGVSGQINSSGPAPAVAPICFPAGTPVTTNQGQVAIEKLNPDIHTIRNKRIVAITQTRPLFSHIVSIEKDALGKNVPSATTQISNEHEVFYKGKMTRAVDLVGVCKGVTQIPYNGETLYNVLLKKHSHMMINNLVCETLHPDNIMAKICGGKYNQVEQNKICDELTSIIKANNLPAYKKLYASLK